MQKYALISSEPYSQQFFTLVNGQVVKAILTVKGSELLAEDPNIGDIVMKLLAATGSITRSVINLGIGAATEADLIAAQKAAPEKAIEIDSLLTYLRAAKDAQAQAANQPIRVEITNASEFADKRGTVVRVERDGAGSSPALWLRRFSFRPNSTKCVEFTDCPNNSGEIKRR